MCDVYECRPRSFSLYPVTHHDIPQAKEPQMLVTLMGPDDLGHWMLADENGNSFPLVECHEDHPAAASLFGWTAPEGVTDEEEIIQDALDWIMDHINENIEAPKDVAEYFGELAKECLADYHETD